MSYRFTLHASLLCSTIFSGTIISDTTAVAQTVTEIMAAQAQDRVATAMLNESHASQIRAKADVLRATADHNRGMAEAEKIRHEANREGLETEFKKAETFYKKKELREKSRRDRVGSKSSSREEAARDGESAADGKV